MSLTPTEEATPRPIGLIRQLVLSGGSRFAVLPLTGLASALTTYLLVTRAGSELFAYVALVGSLFQLLPFTDLGLSAPVINAVSSRLEADGDRIAREVLKRSFLILVATGGSLLLVTILFALLGWWPVVLGLPPAFTAHADSVMILAFLPFCLSVPLSIGQRALVALGKNHLANFAAMVGPVFSVLIITTIVLTSAPDELAVIAPASGVLATALTTTLLAVRHSGWSLRQLVRTPLSPDTRSATFGAAGPMFIISVTVPIASYSHRLLLAHSGASDQLAEYSVAAQFYFPVYSVLAAMAIVLWPAFAQRRGTARPTWLWSLRVFTVIGLMAATGYILLIRPVARLVTDGRIEVNWPLASAFGVLLVVVAIHQPQGMLLTSPAQLTFQAVCTTAMVVVTIGAGLVLIPILGATGIVLANALAVLLAQVVPGIMVALRASGESQAADGESQAADDG